jgi:hypothetical protein
VRVWKIRNDDLSLLAFDARQAAPSVSQNVGMAELDTLGVARRARRVAQNVHVVFVGLAEGRRAPILGALLANVQKVVNLDIMLRG